MGGAHVGEADGLGHRGLFQDAHTTHPLYLLEIPLKIRAFVKGQGCQPFS